MNRCVLILLLISTLLPQLQAQEPKLTKLKFRLVEEGENGVVPIIDVVCQVFDDESKLLTFAITDNRGNATLKLQNGSSYVTFSRLGYKSKRLEVTQLDRDHINTIYLVPKPTQLKEITVKAPPIKRQSDTLIYNISSFANSQDRYIEDVLKKLPGITVADNGSISYQGQSISKLYIEGQDLLGNRYNQATRNLPVDAVSQVQLLENNQNIKVLQGNVFEEKAALNIKLKQKYKLRLFGEVTGGIGGTPLIWDNKLFLTQIGGINQLMITGKMNNDGQDLSDETTEHIDVSNIDMYEIRPQPFLRSATLTPPVNKERQLLNRAYTWGLNDLIKTGDDSHIRLNIVGYHDKINQGYYQDFRYGGLTPTQISEHNSLVNWIDRYTPTIKYELNSSKVFLSNELRMEIEKGLQQTEILNTSKDQIQQSITQKPLLLQNKLQSVFFAGTTLFNFTSNLSYFINSENLSTPYASADYKTTLLSTKNRLYTTIPLGDYRLELGAIADYIRQGYTSQGTVRREAIEAGIKTSILKRYSKGSISLSLPLTWNSQALYNQTHNKHNDRYFSINPSLSWRHDFSSKLTLSASSAYSTSNDTDAFYAYHSVYQNYRTEYISPLKTYRRSSLRHSVSLSYHNLVTMIFANLTLSHNYTTSQYYKDFTYTDHKTVITPIEAQNNRYLTILSADIDKSLIDLGLSIKLSANYLHLQHLLSQYGQAFTNQSNSLTLQADIVFQKLKWLKLLYTPMAIRSWQVNQYSDSLGLNTFANHLRLFFYLNPKLNLVTTYQNRINQLANYSYKSTNFWDLQLGYQINKRVEVQAKLSNILNNKSYISTTAQGPNLHHIEMPLRHREFLISASIKL